MDDPDESLYTVAVVGDLLGIDSQTLRRLGDAISHDSPRPSGNQRRYSRRDIETLADAVRLSNEGTAPAALPAMLALEHRIYELEQDPTDK